MVVIARRGEGAMAVQALNIQHLSDGQIVKEYGQPDMMGLMQQIGVLPR